MCFLYILKKFDVLKLKKEDFHFSMSTINKLLGLGIPMALQFSITAIGTIIVQGAINVYGAVSMAGFSAAGKNSEYHLYRIRVLWCYHCYLCRAEPWRRQDGQSEKGCISHTGNDFSYQLDYDGAGSFLWRVSDVDFRESIGDRSIEGSGNLL